MHGGAWATGECGRGGLSRVFFGGLATAVCKERVVEGECNWGGRKKDCGGAGTGVCVRRRVPALPSAYIPGTGVCQRREPALPSAYIPALVSTFSIPARCH